MSIVMFCFTIFLQVLKIYMEYLNFRCTIDNNSNYQKKNRIEFIKSYIHKHFFTLFFGFLIIMIFNFFGAGYLPILLELFTWITYKIFEKSRKKIKNIMQGKKDDSIFFNKMYLFFIHFTKNIKLLLISAPKNISDVLKHEIDKQKYKILCTCDEIIGQTEENILRKKSKTFEQNYNNNSNNRNNSNNNNSNNSNNRNNSNNTFLKEINRKNENFNKVNVYNNNNNNSNIYTENIGNIENYQFTIKYTKEVVKYNKNKKETYYVFKLYKIEFSNISFKKIYIGDIYIHKYYADELIKSYQNINQSLNKNEINNQVDELLDIIIEKESNCGRGIMNSIKAITMGHLNL